MSEPSAEEFLLALNGTPTEISGNDWIVKKARSARPAHAAH